MEHVLEALYGEYKQQTSLYYTTVEKINKLAEIIKTYGGDAKTTEEMNAVTLETIIADIRDSLYPIDAGWADKILFTLRKFPEPTLTSKIYEFIKRNEPKTFEGKEDNMRNVISSVLSRMVKAREIAVTVHYGKRRYYLLPEK